MLLRTFPEQDRFRKLAEKANVIPVCAEILGDTEKPVSLLTRFYRGKGPICLLESVEGGERWSRYSFLGLSAHATVQVFRDTVVVNEDGQMRTIPHEGKPLDTLRKIMDSYKPAHIPELPRFWGGLIGVIAIEVHTQGVALPWLQAVPDPLTTIAWQTWLEINDGDAARMGLRETGGVYGER